MCCYLVDHGDGELIGWDISVDRVCLCQLGRVGCVVTLSIMAMVGSLTGMTIVATKEESIATTRQMRSFVT